MIYSYMNCVSSYSVVPVKCSYGNPHRSVSMTSDPDHHLPESPAVDISVRTAFTGKLEMIEPIL